MEKMKCYVELLLSPTQVPGTVTENNCNPGTKFFNSRNRQLFIQVALSAP